MEDMGKQKITILFSIFFYHERQAKKSTKIINEDAASFKTLITFFVVKSVKLRIRLISNSRARRRRENTLKQVWKDMRGDNGMIRRFFYKCIKLADLSLLRTYSYCKAHSYIYRPNIYS